MKIKITLSTLLALFITINCFAQNHELQITKRSHKAVRLTENQNVRIAYPANKIDPKQTGNIGLRGKIDSIGKESIWITSRVKTEKPIELSLKDIVALKKSSNLGLIASSIVSYAVIGGGAILLGNNADLNPAITTLLAGAAVFPSVLLGTGVFYPSKPVRKVGEGYTLEIIEAK